MNGKAIRPLRYKGIQIAIELSLVDDNHPIGSALHLMCDILEPLDADSITAVHVVTGDLVCSITNIPYEVDDKHGVSDGFVAANSPQKLRRLLREHTSHQKR
jgi:hypothetical protein